MRLKIIFYGVTLALLVFLLKFLQYRYFIHDLSIEFYAGLIALLFVVLGVWVGSKLTAAKEIIVTVTSQPFQQDQAQLRNTGISKRELEVLELMSTGNSNQEIAEKLFVSTSTVKTHVASLFSKLDVKRRTQAVQKAKELRIIA